MKESIKGKAEKVLMRQTVKRAILDFLSGGQYIEFMYIEANDIIDHFYINLYRKNQKKVEELDKKVRDILNERNELQDKRSLLQVEAENFKTEIRDTSDGLICHLLNIEIERYEDKINGWNALGDRAESVQKDLDAAIDLSVSLAIRMIDRELVTFDQIKTYRYFFKKMGD